MVIFSHRGIGFAEKENSLAAFTQVVKEGFSVEADLRFKDNEVILAHDEAGAFNGPAEFSSFLNLINNNPNILFALHIKENSRLLFERVADSIGPLKNCFLFVTDFDQRPFIAAMDRRLGRERLGLYVTTKMVPSDLTSKAGYLWLDESRGNIYEQLEFFSGLRKKVICCSPELFMSAGDREIKRFKGVLCKNRKDIFGICTDCSLAYSEQLQCG